MTNRVLPCRIVDHLDPSAKQRQVRVCFLMLLSPATLSAAACIVLANVAAVMRPAMSSPIAFWLALSRSPYQSGNLNETSSPALFISPLADVKAVESVTLSPEPFVEVSEWVSEANFAAPSLDSIARRNSMPPAGFALFFGTIHPSPEPA